MFPHFSCLFIFSLLLSENRKDKRLAPRPSGRAPPWEVYNKPLTKTTIVKTDISVFPSLLKNRWTDVVCNEGGFDILSSKKIVRKYHSVAEQNDCRADFMLKMTGSQTGGRPGIIYMANLFWSHCVVRPGTFVIEFLLFTENDTSNSLVEVWRSCICVR